MDKNPAPVLAMQAPQGFAELLDFRFCNVLLVFRLVQLLGDMIQIFENPFEHLANLIQFLPRLLQQRASLGGQLALGALVAVPEIFLRTATILT